MAIVITGASGGLGSYLSEQLMTEHEIIGTYRTRRSALEDVEWYQVDVCDDPSIQRFVLAASEKLEHITLINLAGVSVNGMAHRMGETVWDYVVDTNLKGTFLMCRALLPLMRKQGWGRIINVSSIVGQMGIPGTSAYSASKSGLFGLTRTLAAENALKGITVNALALGYFEVGMIDSLTASWQKRIKASIPMQRFGHPRNLELAVRFLIESDYVTGATININGGLF